MAEAYRGWRQDPESATAAMPTAFKAGWDAATERLEAVLARHAAYLESMADGENDYTSAAFHLHTIREESA